MRASGQQVVPSTQLSPIAQHVLPHGGASKPQHKLCSGMQPLAKSSQQALPHLFSGLQQTPA